MPGIYNVCDNYLIYIIYRVFFINVSYIVVGCEI
jgi:hypothetical protein